MEKRKKSLKKDEKRVGRKRWVEKKAVKRGKKKKEIAPCQKQMPNNYTAYNIKLNNHSGR